MLFPCSSSPRVAVKPDQEEMQPPRPDTHPEPRPDPEAQLELEFHSGLVSFSYNKFLYFCVCFLKSLLAARLFISCAMIYNVKPIL